MAISIGATMVLKMIEQYEKNQADISTESKKVENENNNEKKRS